MKKNDRRPTSRPPLDLILTGLAIGAVVGAVIVFGSGIARSLLGVQ